MSAPQTTHAALLAALLPPESYNPAAPILAAELAAEGAALDAAQASAARLITPGPAVPWLFAHTDLLPHWERLYQITPAPNASAAQRQAQVQARITAKGGLSRAYFQSLLAIAGYQAAIDEPRDFRAGQGRAGDRIYQSGAVTYYWRIHARHPDSTPLTADEKAALTAWLTPLAAAGTHFDIED